MKYIIEDESYNQKNNVLEIEKGHTVFLVGPNSVGKSTLLEALQFSSYKKIVTSAQITMTLTKKILSKSIKQIIWKHHYQFVDEVIKDFKARELILYTKPQDAQSSQFNFIDVYLKELEKLSRAQYKDKVESLNNKIKIIQKEFISLIEKRLVFLRDKKISEFDSLKMEMFALDAELHYGAYDTMKNPLYGIQKKIKNCNDFLKLCKDRFDKFDPYNGYFDYRQKINLEGEQHNYPNYGYLSAEEITKINKLFEQRNELISKLERITIYSFNKNQQYSIIKSIQFHASILFFLDKPNIYDVIREPKGVEDNLVNVVEKELNIKMVREDNKANSYITHALSKTEEEIWAFSDGQVKQIENIILDYKNTTKNQSWDEPFVSLDYNKLIERRDTILNNGKTNLVATHNFASIFPSKTDDIYILYLDGNGKRNLLKLIDVFNLESLPTSIKKIVPRLLHELFSSHPKNLIVEGKDDMLMIKKLYEMLGRKCKINFVPLNGVEKLKVLPDIFSNASDFLNTKTRILLDNDDAAKKTRETFRGNKLLIKLTDQIFSEFKSASSFEKIFLKTTNNNKRRLIERFLKNKEYSEDDINKAKIVCDLIDNSFKTNSNL